MHLYQIHSLIVFVVLHTPLKQPTECECVCMRACVPVCVSVCVHACVRAFTSGGSFVYNLLIAKLKVASIKNVTITMLRNVYSSFIDSINKSRSKHFFSVDKNSPLVDTNFTIYMENIRCEPNISYPQHKTDGFTLTLQIIQI